MKLGQEQEKKRINVGVLIGKINTYHPQELVHGIYQAAKDYDVNVIFMLASQRTQNDTVFHEVGDISQYDFLMNTVYDYADLAGVDVLIVSYGTIGVHLTENNKEKFLNKFSHIPYIVLEDEDEGNFIISDNYQGMKANVEHLIVDHKYKRVGYISGPKGNVDARQRMKAYVDAMNEHGLDIPEDYIIYGDFSTASGAVVSELLEKHPDLEAVVCANDEMAIGAFNTCKQMGLRIGEDIAITGYDNCELAQSMDPPLTTVNQNGYDMGYRALKEAVRLGQGSERIALRVPAAFCKRGSCGCISRRRDSRYGNSDPEELLAHADELAREITDKVVLNKESITFSDKVFVHMKDLIEYMIHTCLLDESKSQEDYDKNRLIHLVRHITNSQYGQFISMEPFLKELGNLFHSYIFGDLEQGKRMRLYKALTSLNEYVYSCMLEQKEKEYNEYQINVAMSPIFERKLVESIHDEQQMYFDCVKGLKQIGARSAMICVTRQPVVCRPGMEWHCPKELMLASYFDQDNMMSFSEKERPVISRENGIFTMVDDKKNRSYMTFPLFAQNCHYGMIACDVDPDKVMSVYVYSLTIGSVLRFMQLSTNERLAQSKLQSSMRLLEEKNKVLSFISAFDELTGMLNRRGFGEKAFEFNKMNWGKHAYFIFADLDHLKEINDKFGHADGDYAIIQCARVLNSSCRNYDLVGRMGGDEFMMMLASEEDDFENKIRHRIKKAFDDLNARSGKPYLVEASIGIKQFICNDDFDFSSMLQQSDQVMYESKKKRRTTIVREENP